MSEASSGAISSSKTPSLQLALRYEPVGKGWNCWKAKLFNGFNAFQSENKAKRKIK